MKGINFHPMLSEIRMILTLKEYPNPEPGGQWPEAGNSKSQEARG